jgi:hypothetical protein
VTPDHWGFVVAAYALAAVALATYWRRLVRLEREAMRASGRRRTGGDSAAPERGPR